MKNNFHKLLENKTVLVLGAGASAPYGFPTGPNLYNRLKEWCQNGKAKKYLAPFGFDNKHIRDFEEVLKLSWRYKTIDQLLETKDEFRKIGSVAIALNILQCENDDNLLNRRDWYEDLFDGIGIFDEVCAPIDNLCIVTYNYDRSLERFFHMNVKLHAPRKIRDTAENRVDSLKILHVHGQLGKYDREQFGLVGMNNETVVQAAEGIHIISDNLEDNSTYIAAKAKVNQASNVIFLGFGYDARSLKFLLGNRSLFSQNISGTAFDIKLEEEREKIISVVGREMRLGPPEYQCRAFLNSDLILKEK